MPFLMKAEPETRIEKGKDVKFSIHDLQEMGESPWDGVRNHVAKNIQKSMKLNDKVLFYHSNCKTPGIYGLATVSREAYPDYTAWDPTHPYFDPRSDQSKPTWYMVSVRFSALLPYPPTLLLIKTLAALPVLPECVEYIGQDGWAEVKEMALIKQGRLSVQPVTQGAYDAVVLLGQKGGWEELVAKPVKMKKAQKVKAEEGGEEKSTPKSTTKGRGKGKGKLNADVKEEKEEEGAESSLSPAPEEKPTTNGRGKRKSSTKSDVVGGTEGETGGSRRSKRQKP